MAALLDEPALAPDRQHGQGALASRPRPSIAPRRGDRRTSGEPAPLVARASGRYDRAKQTSTSNARASARSTIPVTLLRMNRASRRKLPQRAPGWGAKFRHAGRGLKLGVRGESSFFVHFFVAAAVVAAGLALGVDRAEWCLLVLCIAGVLAAEMFNSALERLAQAIDQRHNALLRNALDISSAAVLLAVLGAATVGVIVFGSRLGSMLGGD
jgi:diacylglycerol kinase